MYKQAATDDWRERPVSHILNPKETPGLQPNEELLALYNSARTSQGTMGFRATTRAESEAWQMAARRELVRLLGFAGDPRSQKAGTVEVLEEIDRGGYVQRKVLLTVSETLRMPVYLLLPKEGKGPRPAVIAYAGHGYGVKDIVGLWEDGTLRETPDGYHADFAVQLCRRGFVVAAPEIAGFGERRNNYDYLDARFDQPIPSTCHNAATFATMLGKSLLGMRVRDGMRLVDYLQTLDEVDGERIGAMGISGGGMLTLYHAATDIRIATCVVSGYLSTYIDSILAMDHCTCNFVPGLVAKFEIGDIAGLVLPRPILVEAGTKDVIFPIGSVRKTVQELRGYARIFGVSVDDTVVLDEFEGRHRISGRLSYDFLASRLGLDA